MSRFFKSMLICIFFILTAFGCKKESGINDPSFEEAIMMPSIEGSRIAWDYSSLKQVSPATTNLNYNGYIRLAQLHDNTLLCVYEAGGNIVVVKSLDRGATWSDPITIANKQDGINMAVPDILELQDKSILVCYNPRPFEIHPSRKFGLRTKKSYDGGNTWVEERLLYEAGHEFENGCWEPSALQLPNGEIQLIFADEGPYTQSSEQNISLLRSRDNELSWTNTPEIVSFRPGSRDGMPSPILLNNKEDIAIAIEDNGFKNFKPYIINGSMDFNWSQPALGNSPKRFYALTEKIKENIYAGAPNLGRLKSGETVLSYQGTEERENKMEFAEMKVVLGDEKAQNFNRKTVPFAIPANKSSLWNSIAVLDDNSVIALISTNAYSQTGKTEVWMIKGNVIEPLQAKKQNLVSAAFQEELWH
jgi:hypothetical protein